MAYEQIDLFSDQHPTLNELKNLIESLHWTGGISADGTRQNEEYKIDFYRDLAFIVQFREETDNEEKIIDNCCELLLVENNLYKIIKIDGKTLGEISADNPEQTKIQLALIKSMENQCLWKK